MKPEIDLSNTIYGKKREILKKFIQSQINMLKPLVEIEEVNQDIRDAINEAMFKLEHSIDLIDIEFEKRIKGLENE